MHELSARAWQSHGTSVEFPYACSAFLQLGHWHRYSAGHDGDVCVESQVIVVEYASLELGSLESTEDELGRQEYFAD